MRWLVILITIISVLCLIGLAMAGGAAQHTVTVRVMETAELAIIEDNSIVDFTLPTVTADALLSPSKPTVSSIPLCWNSFVQTGRVSKITAQLDTVYKSDIMFKAALVEPGGSRGISAGQQSLGAHAVDMLMGIGNENCTNATITYEVSPSKTNKLLTSEIITVIWTITDVDGPSQS